MNAEFDRRLHPVRSDLAASSYKNKVKADIFVDPKPLSVGADKAALRRHPDEMTGIDTELYFGETFNVYDTNDAGWSWGQLETDGYVGWVRSDALHSQVKATHRVGALRTFMYPEAEMKRPAQALISMGALVHVVDYETTRGLRFARLSDGRFIVADHLVSLDHKVEDWVSVAESLVGTPYLWGGRSSLGLDCSALIQLSLQAGGIRAPRDADMQEANLGENLDFSSGMPQLKRGDLMFWKGHVGVMSNPDTLLHANGYTMSVAYEDLQAALERIGKNEFGALTSIKRIA